MITANYSDYVDGGSHKEFEISVVGTETTYDNSQMLSESIKLDEALCSEQNLRFGSCESSQFSVQIANSEISLEGKTLEVSVTMDEETTKYGTFKVISDKPTADRIWRVITAYDKMYDIINADVLTWYNGLTFPMTLANFRNSFFNHLGISQVSTNLVNDSFSIPGGFSSTGSLSGKTIITAICEFNGVFGHINRDGNFEYISLDNADSFNCPPYENNSVTYQDYVTSAITKVTMRGSASDVGTSVGVDGNEYIITNNPLIYGTEGSQALITALTNLLNKISLVTFRPFQLNKTIGNPCVELGDAIVITTKYQTINSYVLKRVLSGIQALRDNYSATGKKYYPKEVNTVQEQISRTQGKMNELTRTVDQTVSTVTSLSQNAITTDTLHYLATSLDSGVTTSTAGWTTTPQSMTPTNKYLWTYHTYAHGNGSTTDTTPVITGVYGEDGQQGQPGTSVTITSQEVKYQASSSGTVTPTGTWQSSVPSVSQGQYLWTRTIVNYSNGTSTTSYSVSYQGQNGQNGQDGQDGQDGTSVTISSQSVTYQVSNSGTTVPTGTWQSSPQATSTGQYLWTRTIVNYSNGTSTTAYSVSAHGQTGSAGKGVSEVIPLYYAKSNNTAPSAPSSNVTTNTDVQGAWTRAIPTLSTSYPYLFTCDQIKYTNNTYTWSTVVLNNALTEMKSSISQLAGEIVLKVDNNGNIVKVALDASASTGTTFKVTADNISFIANGVIDLTANALSIKTTNFTMDTNGNITLTNGGVLNIDAGNNQNAAAILLTSSGTDYSYTSLASNLVFTHYGYHLDQIEYDCEMVTGQLYLSRYDSTLIPDEGEETVDNFTRLQLTNNSIELIIGDKNFPSSWKTLFFVAANGAIKSNSLTASKILVSDANKNIVSSSYEFDVSTNNTSDTWLLVMNNGKIQHRISTNLSVNDAKKLTNYYASRPTSANILLGDGSAITFQATSSMTTGKPASDSHILHLAWDNTGGWDSQLAVSNGGTTPNWRAAVRSQSSGTWSNWIKLLDELNGVQSYADSTFYRVTALLTFKSSNNALVAGDKGNYIWGISSWSDSRLKKNVKNSKVNALDVINNIKMREFDFKDEKYGHHEDIGYVAHELREIVPECVVDIPISEEEQKEYKTDTLMQVEDKHLIKYLVKAVQELSAEVERLKNK